MERSEILVESGGKVGFSARKVQFSERNIGEQLRGKVRFLVEKKQDFGGKEKKWGVC